VSSGMWPVHMAPAPWQQQIWLNPHQRVLGAGVTPVNNDASTDTKTGSQSTATTTQNQTAEPKSQSEARTPQPQNSVETTTLEETSKTVPASSPKQPPPNPIPLNSSTATTTSVCRVTVAEGTQTTDKDDVNSDVASADQHIPDSQTSPNGSLEGQLEGERGEGEGGGMRKRRMDAKSKLQYSEMMDKFRNHASVLALSTKVMIRANPESQNVLEATLESTLTSYAKSLLEKFQQAS
jgi:hypothetical protein